MGNAHAGDHSRVAKDGWRAGEVIKESNSGAKQDRRDVDVDFVEEASVQALLDGVSAVDPIAMFLSRSGDSAMLFATDRITPGPAD